MADNQNGWAEGTEGLPEPPLRGSFAAQRADAQADTTPLAIEPDTSGIDTAGHISQTSSFMPVASAEATESFAAARSGDTDAMPRADVERVQVPYRSDEGLSGLEAAPAASAGTAPAGYAAVPAAGGAGYAGAQAPAQAAQPGAYQARPQAQPQAQAQAQASRTAPAKQQKSGSGGGKSFLFGFLGALCACAIALGGFAFAGGLKAPTAGSTALIGTTDQSVINAVDEGQTLAEAVAAKALPSVVAIYNYQNASSSYGFGYGYGMGNQGGDNMVATGMGSGVVISDEGYIITNYHVVEDAAKLTVSVDGAERDATYVGGDSSSDIAVVKVEDSEGLVTADIGDSDSLRIGEWVMTVGAPLGLEQSVATGVVSATNRSQIMDSSSNGNDLYSYFYGSSDPEYTYYPNMIQTDAVINPGNSGGALVDADGKLIGINAMISSYSGDYAGVGFAIPVNYAISIAEDVIAGKEPTHAMLGVSLSQVNSQIAQRYNLSADQGAYISAISPDTGAADSDLAVGDIITKIDGKAVTSPTDVTLDIRAHKVGDTVTVTVNRDGETVDVEVTLTSDESIAKNAAGQQDEEEGQKDDRQGGPGAGGNDRGDSWGDGNGRGYDLEDLEELLKMFGM